MFKKTSAFTLIEVLVAAGLTAMVIIGCVYLIASSGRQVNSIQELDEIMKLHSSYKNCLTGENVRPTVGLGEHYVYISTEATLMGCKIGVSGGSNTGNTIYYYRESSIPGTHYKKEEYFGTFQSYTGTLTGEILIKERINGPTLHKEFEYSVFGR